MFETKSAAQCDSCHRAITCSKKELAAEAIKLLAKYDFMAVSCNHFLGDEPELELPLFLRNKRGA